MKNGTPHKKISKYLTAFSFNWFPQGRRITISCGKTRQYPFPVYVATPICVPTGNGSRPRSEKSLPVWRNILYLCQGRQIAFKLDFFFSFLLLGSGANELRFQTKCSITSKNNPNFKLCSYSCGRNKGYTCTCIKWTNSTCRHEHIVFARTIKFGSHGWKYVDIKELRSLPICSKLGVTFISATTVAT